MLIAANCKTFFDNQHILFMNFFYEKRLFCNGKQFLLVIFTKLILDLMLSLFRQVYYFTG